MTAWTLTSLGRPMTANKHRTLHHHVRAAHDKLVRETFWALAKQAKVPALAAITVDVRPVSRTRRFADCCACAPDAKAAIDGAAVDAGVIPDDSPQYLKRVTFHAPTLGDADALVLTISEAP